MGRYKKRVFQLLCLALSVSMVLVLSGVSTAEAAEVAAVQSDSYLASYESVEYFDDGGKDYTYVIDGVESHYFVPPEDFDPIEASDEELARYGFPARPADTSSEDYADWVAQMEHYTGTPEPSILVSTKGAELGTDLLSPCAEINAVTSTSNSVWSGYISNLGSSSSTLYTQVEMNYTQPKISSILSSKTCTNSYWVGLGGKNSKKLVQAGTMTQGLATHKAWFQYRSNSSGNSTNMTYKSLSVSAGDSIYVYISFQRANNLFNYYIANNTTGKSVSGAVTLTASTYYDGTTAEWIVERCPLTNDTSYGLGNYGTITLKNCKASLNTSDDMINLGSLSGLTKVTMKSADGTILSSPSGISSDNQFTCTWKNYS